MRSIKKFLRNKDIILLAIIIVAASVSRIIYLEFIPQGLHGDEGWTGIDAKRILNEGWIGPYIGSALGQPTGPMYFTALIFTIFDDSIFWLRFSMTFFGIITIPLFYIFLRQSFSKSISILATIALCFSLYHLHYSRIAFMLISAPVFQIIAYWGIFKWRNNKNALKYLIISAIATGLGIYTYNSFVLFPLSIFSFFTLIAIREKFNKKLLHQVSLFTIIFAIISFPLIKIIIFQSDFYFQHYNMYSTTNHLSSSPDSFIEPSLTFVKNGLINVYKFFTGYSIDYVDGYGTWNTFSYTFLLFMILGIIHVIRHPTEKNLFILFSLLIFISPLFLTTEGTYRRPILSMVPLFYCLALGVYSILSNKIAKKYKTLSMILVSGILIIESIININLYFTKFSKDYTTKWIFTYTLTEASKRIPALSNKDTIILFYSNRWSCQYETSRYLFNTSTCENRSHEFGIFNLASPRDYDVIYVLLDNYIVYFTEIRNMYPDGEVTEILDSSTNNIISIIYKL